MYVDLRNSLSCFKPVSLNEMDSVRLMNRTDTKYVFPANRLESILELASLKYKVLEIEEQRDFSYTTTYLDTDDFLFFYHQSIGKLHRHKVRYRVYESSGTSFLEIKRKTNKNRTIKWRIINNLNHETCDRQAVEFLKAYIPDTCYYLKPVITNKFNRITLVGLDTLERITLDYSLSFVSKEDKKLDMPYLAIAELKREGFSSHSPFIEIIRKFNIRQTGFSKYCIGSALLYDLPNKNRLKQKFILINKIKNECNCLYSKQN